MSRNTLRLLIGALIWVVMALLLFPVFLPAGSAGAYPLVAGLLPKWFVILLVLFAAYWILLVTLFVLTLGEYREPEGDLTEEQR